MPISSALGKRANWLRANLRFLLVDYYIDQGMQEIDRKFFGAKKD